MIAKQVKIDDLLEKNEITEKNFKHYTWESLFSPYLKKAFPLYWLKKYSRKFIYEKTARLIVKVFLDEMMRDILERAETFEFPSGAIFEVQNVAYWRLKKRTSHLYEYRPTYTIPLKQFKRLKKPYFVKLYPRYKEIFNDKKEEGIYV